MGDGYGHTDDRMGSYGGGSMTTAGIDLTAKRGTPAPEGSALPLILAALVAAVVMMLAFLIARDLQGKSTAKPGSRPSA